MLTAVKDKIFFICLRSKNTNASISIDILDSSNSIIESAKTLTRDGSSEYFRGQTVFTREGTYFLSFIDTKSIRRLERVEVTLDFISMSAKIDTINTAVAGKDLAEKSDTRFTDEIIKTTNE